MEMRAARIIGACGILALGALGCGKVSRDNGIVVASVGGEKITQTAFNQTVNVWVGDPAKAKDILTNPAMRGQRNQILGSLVNQKALLQMVKAEGLDKDPKVQLQVEAALADDLAVYHFWPALFAFCRFANGGLAAGGLPPGDAARLLAALGRADAALLLLDPTRLPVPRPRWPAEAARLVAERLAARQSKDFVRADSLRAAIEALGYRVEDAADGVRLFPQG